tara:strand:+ start:38382 stop:38582 length:201 start_codon:yes stop_codon:yes gene_type:complete
MLSGKIQCRVGRKIYNQEPQKIKPPSQQKIKHTKVQQTSHCRLRNNNSRILKITYNVKNLAFISKK